MANPVLESAKKTVRILLVPLRVLFAMPSWTLSVLSRRTKHDQRNHDAIYPEKDLEKLRYRSYDDHTKFGELGRFSGFGGGEGGTGG